MSKLPGITFLSSSAQEKLIRSTYQNAGLSFDETGFLKLMELVSFLIEDRDRT
jgi:hypothetical protein